MRNETIWQDECDDGDGGGKPLRNDHDDDGDDDDDDDDDDDVTLVMVAMTMVVMMMTMTIAMIFCSKVGGSAAWMLQRLLWKRKGDGWFSLGGGSSVHCSCIVHCFDGGEGGRGRREIDSSFEA